MFKIIGGIIGFFMLVGFGPLGWILGIYLGSFLGKTLDQFIFGSGRNNSHDQRNQDAYRRFYEQFYQNTDQNGYRHGYANNGYNPYGNSNATESCYQTLGCSSSDSTDVIKKSYRKLVSKYHPDRIEGQGLSQGEVQAAEDRFKEIQDSYDRIKKTRGI